MRKLDCRNCGKLLIELEKGRIATKGIVLYCVDCDPAKAAKEAPVDFSELFRNMGNK